MVSLPCLAEICCARGSDRGEAPRLRFRGMVVLPKCRGRKGSGILPGRQRTMEARTGGAEAPPANGPRLHSLAFRGGRSRDSSLQEVPVVRKDGEAGLQAAPFVMRLSPARRSTLTSKPASPCKTGRPHSPCRTARRSLSRSKAPAQGRLSTRTPPCRRGHPLRSFRIAEGATKPTDRRGKTSLDSAGKKPATNPA